MVLADTIIRKIATNARAIRRKVKKGKSVPCIVELSEEPGEVLITLLMEKEQVEEAVNEAVTKVLFPTKKFQVKNIGYGNDLLWFIVEPSP